MMRLVFTLLVVFVAYSCAASGGSVDKSVVDHALLELLQEFNRHKSDSQPDEPFQAANSQLRIVDNSVLIDVIASDNVNKLENDLRRLGATHLSSYDRTVSCFFPISNIEQLVVLESLQFVRPVIAITHQGDITRDIANE